MSKIIAMIKSLRYIDFSFFKKNNLKNKIRDQWGKEKIMNRNFNLISIYHDLIKSNTNQQYIDENTWNDLNMNSVFSKIDRNVSTVGSQFLYNLLHRYENDHKVLSDRYDQYQYFLKEKNIREKIQIILYKLHQNNSYYIPKLIFQKLPKRPKFYIIFYLLSFSMILSMALIFYNPIFLFLSLILAVINLSINYFYGRKITGYIVDLSYLRRLLKVGIKLSNLNTSLPQVEKLSKLKKLSITLIKKLGWLTTNSIKFNEILAMVVEYLNYFCLFNVLSFVHAIEYIKSNQDSLKEIYKAVGSLDTNISIASYKNSLSYCCRPKIVNEKIIKARKIYHPLLENSVPNTFDIKNKSVLITGSNMAGKTTFMKTIGVNIILSRSLSICLSENAILPKLVIKSSIRRSDDLDDNKSYYFKEIEAINQFLMISSRQNNYLFLIDEIFRGTNTVERIASATSVLKYLSQYSVIFVTTHDIELQQLLSDNFEMYHFNEVVQDNNHYFDYKIKSGPTSSRNAIKLLKIKGYPKEIIKKANELAESLDCENLSKTD